MTDLDELSSYLELKYNDDIDFEKYHDLKHADKICPFCKIKCTKEYMTYITIDDENIKMKTCYLCHITLNMNKQYMDKIFLVKSKLEQYEINKKTLEYFYKNNRVPLPNEIDKNAKIVKLQIYQYIKMNEYADNKYDIGKYVIFFTNEISKDIDVKEKSMFFNAEQNSSDDEKSIEKYCSDYFDIEHYEFKKHELDNMNKINEIICRDEMEELTMSKKSLDKKMKIYVILR